MGVGKSSVARHLEHLLGCPRSDLDFLIEEHEGKPIADIIRERGIDGFRRLETEILMNALGREGGCILSLGGGTWTMPENRRLISANGYISVWLESSFEHCWYNIKFSRKERPLASNKEQAKALFDERQSVYCLAEWHFLIKPGLTSYEIARQIADQIS
jgi:shikimate kinase